MTEEVERLKQFIKAYCHAEIDALFKDRLASRYPALRYYNWVMTRLLIGIYNLCKAGDVCYYAAFALGKSMAEVYIDGFFVLKDPDSRGREIIRDRSRPFNKTGKFEEYKRIEQRAADAGLSDFYRETYSSLCYYGHPDGRSCSTFDINSKSYKRNKAIYIDHMIALAAEFFKKVSDTCKIEYPQDFNCKLIYAINRGNNLPSD